MGIGNLYRDVLTRIGAKIVTVDTNPEVGADYTSVEQALSVHSMFDTVHICTPNFTHFNIAHQVAPYAKIVFIEKPGVANSENWMTLIHTHPKTRFMMVKNNQWRSEFATYKQLAETVDVIKLNWINKNRIPKPGSWFTNKQLAYGGVSRDLLPHLLSYYTAFFPDFLTKSQVVSKYSTQQWKLEDLVNSDYGDVVVDGVYDVDDRVELEYRYNDKTVIFIADWRSDKINNIGLEFIVNKGPVFTFELGLCPEEAYEIMIRTAWENLNESNFWQNQLIQDVWIHDIMNGFQNES